MAESLLKKFKRTNRLPSPPGTALQILRLCQEEETSVSDMASTLAADPALSMRLLKYANSALIGYSKEITNVRDAVLVLGMKSVRMMALSFSLITTNDKRACQGFDYGRYWSHSVACAVAARELAKLTRQAAPEEAFAVGLLAHIGKLFFAVCIPEKYAGILEAAGGLMKDTTPYENKFFDTDYYNLGADLIKEWGIPQRLADAVRYQRSYNQLQLDSEVKALASLTNSGINIAAIMDVPHDDQINSPYWETLEQSGLFNSQEHLQEIIDKIRNEFHELADVLSLEKEIINNAEDIQAEAGEVLGELSLTTQLKSEAIEKENQGLMKKALTDALTGIANRAALDKHLKHAWSEALRRKQPIGVIMLDVDLFKKFNDNYGHHVGDLVLKGVAQAITRTVRNVDFVARYGGEEFTVILNNADRMTAAHICVKIRKAVESSVIECEGKQYRVTVSIGSAIMPMPSKNISPQQLLELADQQLYASKNKGRNCCSMKQYSPQFQPASV